MAERVMDVNKKRTLVLFLLTHPWVRFREYGFDGFTLENARRRGSIPVSTDLSSSPALSGTPLAGVRLDFFRDRNVLHGERVFTVFLNACQCLSEAK